MLCVTQLSAARGSLADIGSQAAVAGVQVADAAGTHSNSPLAQVCFADLSSEASEPMLPQAVALSAGVGVSRPAGHITLTLPHPLIEGPQRPPRVLHA